ncbi:MAG: prepilin-type N-terminal cleavage/methylation domain-containing protein [Gammaproteobacteria bacterium]|nr:prepilin-type N-terminal cleavage/methylation domain-containing protein [Gammaproteobacteria bacterium]
MRNTSKQSGFTLLEIMMSMTLTAMLLGMLSAGLYSVVNDWQNETSVLDETLDKSLVLLQIERALFAAFPHSYINMDRLSRVVYFNGDESEMRWVSAVSPQRRNGLTAWRLTSDSVDGLQITLTPAYSDNPDVRFEELEPTVILPNYEVEFRYLVQRNDDEKEWLDEWAGEEMQSLPIAVHIIFSPIDEELDEEVLEVLAAIRTWQHEDIQPNISPI